MPILEIIFALVAVTACLAALMWVASQCTVWLITTYYNCRDKHNAE